MEPGVMLSAVREYFVKGQRIFMQNLRLEEAKALSGKDLRRSRHHLENRHAVSALLEDRRTRRQIDAVVLFRGDGKKKAIVL